MACNLNYEVSRFILSLVRGFGRLAAFCALILRGLTSLAHGAELDPTTLNAWHKYIDLAQARFEKGLSSNQTSGLPGDIENGRAQVEKGAIIVSSYPPRAPVKLETGLVHDWVGSVFIPNVTLAEVMRVVRDYSGYKTYFDPNVRESRTIALGDSTDRFSMVLQSDSYFISSAIEADFESRFTRLDSGRIYSITQARRVQEIEHYGSAHPRLLADGFGTGLVWRMVSFTEYIERDSGVLLQTEAIVLSRDIPFCLRWAVEPIVRRTSVKSLSESLRQTRSAVRRRATASADAALRNPVARRTQ